MATDTQSILFLSQLTTIILLLLLQNPRITHSKTSETDIRVLRSIKQSIDPNSISPASFLNSWNFEVDPCEDSGANFLGVLCTAPEDKNSSARVTTINLEGDWLEGFLTPILGNLTELTVLNLRRNKFRGPIPDSIVNLKKVTRLLLSQNFFSGMIPGGLSNLKRLEVIDLSGNRLSGQIPASISVFRGLTRLSLSDNEFTGRIPDLTALWQLTTLDLSRNQLFGNLPNFPKYLRSLSLHHNLLSGHITFINKLQYLTRLDVSDNRLSGSVNRDVLTLPELNYINISSNRFDAIEIIRMTNRPSQLRVLEAQANRFHGHLPLYLVTYRSLNSINLAHNMFSGEIPEEYGERIGRAWTRLVLDYNLLEGGLPRALGQSKNAGSGFESNRVRVSFAHNCLNCPRNNPLCRGGQRPASECLGRA